MIGVHASVAGAILLRAQTNGSASQVHNSKNVHLEIWEKTTSARKEVRCSSKQPATLKCFLRNHFRGWLSMWPTIDNQLDATAVVCPQHFWELSHRHLSTCKHCLTGTFSHVSTVSLAPLFESALFQGHLPFCDMHECMQPHHFFQQNLDRAHLICRGQFRCCGVQTAGMNCCKQQVFGLAGPCLSGPRQPPTERQPSQGRQGGSIKKQIGISFCKANESVQKNDGNELAFAFQPPKKQTTGVHFGSFFTRCVMFFTSLLRVIWVLAASRLIMVCQFQFCFHGNDCQSNGSNDLLRPREGYGDLGRA